MISVTDYLEQTAERFPDKAAFIDDTSSLTFAQLRYEARLCAMGLVHRHLFQRPVVVFMGKSPRCVAAFLGVAYSGNFYAPIDTKMPIARLQRIMETLSPAVIITEEDHAVAARLFAGTAEVITYESLLHTEIDDVALDAATARITDADLLYVLFTSGSTGIPKGVTVPHRGVIAYIEWASNEFSIDDQTVFGNQTPFYFSMSVMDIFQTIRNGCTTYLIPHNLFSFPMRLLEYLAEKEINTIYWVPSALCLVANLKALENVDVPCLKKILFAGEVMPTKQLNMWRKTFPDVFYANLYGPTEVTDICAYFPVARDFRDVEQLPIGVPCRNAGLVILDEQDRAVEEGEAGELCVYGSILAYGYYNNPERTAAAFIQNPLNKSYPQTIYRTGDLVRLNDRGELVYLGRKDTQIKHMGHRIELGEIEAAVSSLEGVERCACLYDTSRRGRIVLYFTGTIEPHDITPQLKTLLPEYMLPNRKVRLDMMPLNPNGKIDRVELSGYLAKGGTSA